MQKILLEPKNALIKQYIYLLELDGIKLDFTQEALDYIVDKAIELKLGARGLRSIIEKIMTDLMYEAPASKRKNFSIDLKYAQTQFESSIFSFLNS